MFLDGSGRCVAKIGEFEGNLDNLGRPWTLRRVLHNRRVQVRFLSHLPEGPEFTGIAALWPQPISRALTPILALYDTTKSSTAGL